MPLKIRKPQGRRYWYITGTLAGKRIYESTGTDSAPLAEEKRAAREAELFKRDLYGAEATATFAEAVNLHLDAGGEDRYLARIYARFGRRRLATLKQADLDAGARADYPNAKPSTVNRQYYTPFIAIMNTAAINDLCAYRRWKRPRRHNMRTQVRWLWPDEYEAVWQAAPAHGRALLDAMVGTGLRESEAVFLDWNDISLRYGQGWIPAPKNDEPRRIELPSRTVVALSTILHREGRVFVNGGGGDYVLDVAGGGVLSTGFHAWAKDAGVAPFGAHILRHTFATWFYSATLDRERLKALGGWKSNEVDRYCHLAPRGLKDDLRRFGWDFGGGGGDARDDAGNDGIERTGNEQSAAVLRHL